MFLYYCCIPVFLCASTYIAPYHTGDNIAHTLGRNFLEFSTLIFLTTGRVQTPSDVRAMERCRRDRLPTPPLPLCAPPLRTYCCCCWGFRKKLVYENRPRGVCYLVLVHGRQSATRTSRARRGAILLLRRHVRKDNPSSSYVRHERMHASVLMRRSTRSPLLAHAHACL